MKLQTLFEFDIHTEREFLKLDKINPSQVMKWLEDNGFKQQGKGHFAKVYAKQTGNRVIKVIKRVDNAYLSFVELAMNNPNNKHMPKIYWNNHYKTFTVIALEKLKPLTYPFENIDSMELMAIKTFIDDIGITDSTLVNHINKKLNTNQYNINSLIQHLLYKTLNRINKLNLNLDIFESKNYMVRVGGKPTIVVTDPVFSYEDAAASDNY